jgi:MFS family permease
MSDTPRTSPRLGAVAAATFLTLVPVTLLVPALTELVVDRHGGTRFQAHLFVALNQLAGVIAVPFAMTWMRRRREAGHDAAGTETRRWIAILLALDALAFLGMGAADSLAALFAWRAVDGLTHLPALSFLMIAANRAGGERRGASLGIVATALMIGVGVGLPVGGALANRDPHLVYPVGAALLGLAAVTALGTPTAALRNDRPRSRYVWDRRRLASWMPLAYGFADRFLIGVFSSTFTIFLTEVHGLDPAKRGMLMSLFLFPFALLCWPAGRAADRFGWFGPILLGNIGFGLLYAAYGVIPLGWLPVAMVVSGALSALMFSPSLVLVSEFARRGAGEGLFGVFQVAGSFGFLAGPIIGGLLVETLRTAEGVPRWATIFSSVGIALVALGLVSWRVLGRLHREWETR